MAQKKFLILEARFYEHIADMLAEGAISYLNDHNISFDRIEVPGALEIPSALSYAVQSDQYDGYIVLGCVIRGETSHYEIVCNESARGVYDVALSYDVPVGNGILTVENEAQAIKRADPAQKNKGKDAAEAALKLLTLRDRMLNDEQESAA